MTPVRYEDVTPEQWAALDDCVWGPPGEEHYSCDSADDAIERLIDDMAGTPVGTVTIVAMRPVTLTDRDWTRQLDLSSTIENLDCEYGDRDEAWSPTDAVVAAWDAFVAAMKTDYHVWICEPALCVTVDAVAWTREHRPDWLTPAPGEEPDPADPGEADGDHASALASVYGPEDDGAERI